MIDFVEIDGRSSILLADVNGISLKQFLQLKPSLPDRLQIAQKWDHALAELHVRGIAHCDVNPTNVLIVPHHLHVFIIDLGNARYLGSNQQSQHSNMTGLQGLPYLAPELTGRTQHKIDERCDLYGFGASLYEIFTGQPPFRGATPIEMIHAHLAQTAAAPRELNAELPECLSQLILRLLAKSPADRYQGILGVAHDLNAILQLIKSDARDAFAELKLGETDRPLRLSTTNKIYGRDDEIETLANVWQQTQQDRSHFVLLQGSAGAGKTYLISELGRRCWNGHAYIASGKYDLFARDIPYYGIVQVVRQIISTLQAEKDSIYQGWLTSIRQALGTDGKLLTDLIPEFDQLLNLGETQHELTPNERKKHIQRAFLNFLATFANLGRPIVIFLDDLQWADISSLELLSLWTREAIPRTLFIASARQETPPYFRAFVDAWKQEVERFHYLSIGPIRLQGVTQWCHDLLKWSLAECKQLAETIYERSHANPLFIQQIFQTLYRDKLLYFSLEKNQWEADYRAIKLIPMNDQLIDLLISRLNLLPLSLRKVLSCGSFLGNSFTLQSVSSITTLDINEAQACLTLAIRENLVFIDHSESSEVVQGSAEQVNYRFVHDRVIEACQSLLSAEEIKLIRLQCGRYLIGSRNLIHDFQLSELPTLFYALSHVIAAQDLLSDDMEKFKFASLAYEVGEQAKSAAAWDIGVDIFHGGVQFLDGVIHPQSRSLRRLLELGEGSCAMLAGDPANAKILFEKLLLDCQDAMETAEIQSMRCRLYAAMEQFHQAIDAGMEGLRALGQWRGSNKITLLQALWEASRCQKRLNDLDDTALDALPEVTDVQKLLAMRIISETQHPALIADPYLGISLAAKQIDLMLRYGYSRYSLFALLSLIMSINGATAVLAFNFWTPRSLDIIRKFLQKIAGRYESDRTEYERQLAYHGFTTHLQPEFRQSPLGIAELIPRLIEAGSYQIAGAAILLALDMGLFSGHNLIKLQHLTRGWREYAEHRLEPRDRDGFLNFQETIKLLIDGQTEEIISFLPSIMDPNKIHFIDLAYRCGILTRQGALFAIFGRFAEAYKILMKAWLLGVAKRQAGNYKFGLVMFYLAVACHETLPSLHGLQRFARKCIFRFCRRMLKIYGSLGPAFARHKFLFIEGLKSSQSKRDTSHGIDLIEQAIELARREKFLIEEAWMAEHLGRILISQNNYDKSQKYFQIARSAFESCGMLAKVRDLEKYASVVAKKTENYQNDPIKLRAAHSVTRDTMASLVDLPTLIRASNTLSRELRLGQLKKQMLNLLVENAGARYAALLWRNKRHNAGRDPMKIVAHLSPSGGSSEHENSPSDHFVSLRIIAYVERSQRALVVRSVATDPMWDSDPALRSRGIKSVLCIPIIVADELNGVIYLENDLLEDAFSEDRVEILNVLSAQIAISLDNANLYEQLSTALSAEQKARAEEQSSYQAYILAEEARSKLQAGLEAAEIVQKALINVQPMHPSYKISYLYEPAENTGGDWLTTFYDEQRRWVYLCLGDVTGHGVPAAMITAAVAGAAASAVSRVCNGDFDLAGALQEIMTSMNVAVSMTRAGMGQVMTMVIVAVDLTTGDACYLNAAHQPLIRTSTNQNVIIESGGLLGFDAASGYGLKRFVLEPEESLVLFSDGLIENKDLDGQSLKFRELRRLVVNHKVPQAIVEALKGYTQRFVDNGRRDDTACLVFQWLGPVLSIRKVA